MRKTADISTAIGLSMAIVLVGMAIYLGGAEEGFFDIKSILIVVGGTFFITMACFTIPEIWNTQKLIIRTVFYTSENPRSAAVTSLEIAELARKKGLLGLQKHDSMMHHNPFLRKAIHLVIDGIPFKDVERILTNEINSTFERHKKGSSILKKAAEISPAMGLIGTLIGLVQMLGNLSDPSSIGPAMATALLTTLYGAVLSFMILTPLASKLERNSKAEIMIMKIYLHTATSIGKKENPRRLEMIINSTLPPSKRVEYFG